MKLIDLHLVSWNRPAMTELTVRTIHRNTTPCTFRISVLDNGSDQETVEMLHRLQEEKLVHAVVYNGENRGLESGRQTLLDEYTDSTYFVDCDNDCLPPPPDMNGGCWLERMVRLMDDNGDYAAISQRTQVMIGTGNIFEDESKELTDFPHPGGSLRIMNTAAVRLTNGWDRETPLRGAEERYICGKLREAGYKTAFATRIRCLHLFGVRSRTKERWGYSENMRPEESGHSDIWHPALNNGDDFDMVAAYSGRELADDYFNR